MTPHELAATVCPLFEGTVAVSLCFGKTVELGPKKVMTHMVDSLEGKMLHEKLRVLLDEAGVTFQSHSS